jgi:hypothetical protein
MACQIRGGVMTAGIAPGSLSLGQLTGNIDEITLGEGRYSIRCDLDDLDFIRPYEFRSDDAAGDERAPILRFGEGEDADIARRLKFLLNPVLLREQKVFRTVVASDVRLTQSGVAFEVPEVGGRLVVSRTDSVFTSVGQISRMLQEGPLLLTDRTVYLLDVDARSDETVKRIASRLAEEVDSRKPPGHPQITIYQTGGYLCYPVRTSVENRVPVPVPFLGIQPQGGGPHVLTFARKV